MNRAENAHREIQLAREVSKIAIDAVIAHCATTEKAQRALWRIIHRADRLRMSVKGRRNVYSIRGGGAPLQDDRRSDLERSADLAREIAAELLTELAEEAQRQRGAGVRPSGEF